MCKHPRIVAIIGLFCQLSWALAGTTGVALAADNRLDSLIAPIALYPDPLVAQILAASTNPSEIAEATAWVSQHPDLKGDQLARAVRSKDWDPSVRALTRFPSVLSNLNQNQAWTIALGATYSTDPGQVMRAIQRLRRRAEAAGKLTSNSAVKVVEQGQTIVIQPANPKVVYVPSYNPTLVYGAPVAAYPGYLSANSAFPAVLSFGAGVALGALAFGGGGWGWGWGGWRCNWGHNSVSYNNRTFNTNNHSWSDNSIDASEHTHLHDSESDTKNSDELNGDGTHGSEVGGDGMGRREAPSDGGMEQPESGGLGGGDTGEGMGRREEPEEPSGTGYEAPSGDAGSGYESGSGDAGSGGDSDSGGPD